MLTFSKDLVQAEVFDKLACTDKDCPDRSQPVVSAFHVLEGNGSEVFFACAHCHPLTVARLDANFSKVKPGLCTSAIVDLLTEDLLTKKAKG